MEIEAYMFVEEAYTTTINCFSCTRVFENSD